MMEPAHRICSALPCPDLPDVVLACLACLPCLPVVSTVVNASLTRTTNSLTSGSDGHGTHARTQPGLCVAVCVSVSWRSCRACHVMIHSCRLRHPQSNANARAAGAHFMCCSILGHGWMRALLRMPCVLVRPAHLRCACCCCWLLVVCPPGLARHQRAIARPLPDCTALHTPS
jgi:hypothetical protein